TLYQSGKGERALGRWAEKIAARHRGKEPKAVEKIARTKAHASGPRDVFCYFDNTDVKLRAPGDAQTLMRKHGLTPGAPPALEAHRPRKPAATHLSAARFNKPGSSRMSANVR